MADHHPTFEIVERGYDPDQVDRFLAGLLDPEAAALNADLLASAAGRRATGIMQEAETTAREMLESVAWLREIAAQEVDAIADRVREQAQGEAKRVLDDARSEAHRIRLAARREAAMLRQADRPASSPGKSDLGEPDHMPERTFEDLLLASLMKRVKTGLPKLNAEDAALFAQHLAG